MGRPFLIFKKYERKNQTKKNRKKSKNITKDNILNYMLVIIQFLAVVT